MRVWGVDAFAAGRTRSRCAATAPRWCASSTARGTAYDVVPEHAGGMVRLGRNDDWDAARVTVATDSFVHPTVWCDLAWDGARVERHRNQALGVDLDVVRVRALPRAGRRRHAGARHRDAPPRHAARRQAPCVLYGYGSYEAPCDPDWGIDWWRSVPSLLDRGVVFAVGHPRGGGEMGRRWWDDGHLAAKHHTFDDQAAVGEWLLDGRVSGDRHARPVGRRAAAGRALLAAARPVARCRRRGAVRRRRHLDARPVDPAHRAGVARVGRPARPRAGRVHGGVQPDVEPARRGGSGRRCSPPARCTTRACSCASLRAGSRGCVRPTRRRAPATTRPRRSRRARVLFRCETGAGAHGGPSRPLRRARVRGRDLRLGPRAPSASLTRRSRAPRGVSGRLVR